MNTHLTNPIHPRRIPDRTGQPALNTQANQLINAVNEALTEHPTTFRDTNPLPSVGTTPPVPQPGRPPMSQKATDASALMLSGGAATLLVGGGTSLVLLASGYADPVVCAIVLGTPAAAILAVSHLVKRAKDVVAAAPPTVHNHYNATVHQDSRSTTSHTRGVIATTRNHPHR